MRQDFFLYGVNYGGQLPRDEWAADFKQIKKTGFNVVRYWAGWYSDWNDVDYIVDLAEENNLKMLFTLATIIIPAEFLDKYPDIGFVDRNGRCYQPESLEDLRWPQACYNHPGYREEIVKLFNKIVNRYKNKPALWAWSVHNEPWTMPCYSKYTVAAFQEWLMNKYGSLDNLNSSWRSLFKKWNEVEPPKFSPREGGSPAAWIDWADFLYDNVSRFVEWEANAVRDIDPNHLIVTNPTRSEVFYRLKDAPFDALGVDFYPSWEFRSWSPLQKEKMSSSIINSHRDAACNKTLWVMEVQGGPNAESIDYGSDEIRMETWAAIAHGMKGVLYYRWDPLWGGAEPWVHYLKDVEGHLSERVKECNEISNKIAKYENLLLRSENAKSEVAIMYSFPSSILSEGMGFAGMGFVDERSRYQNSYSGTYRIFLDNFVPVNALRPEEVVSSRLEGYKLLLLPFTYCMDEETADVIKEFVKKGGTVVAESICAAFSEWGEPYDNLPGAGLSELFGCSVTGMSNFKYWLVGHPVIPTPQGADILGLEKSSIFWLCGVKEHLKLDRKAEVLLNFMPYASRATFFTTSKYDQETEPAMIINQFGKGHAVYFASSIGESYLKTENAYIRRLFASLLEKFKVEKTIELKDIPGNEITQLETALRENESNLLLFVLNHGSRSLTPRIELRTKISKAKITELLRDTPVLELKTDEQVSFKSDIPPRNCCLYLVTPN